MNAKWNVSVWPSFFLWSAWVGSASHVVDAVMSHLYTLLSLFSYNFLKVENCDHFFLSSVSSSAWYIFILHSTGLQKDVSLHLYTVRCAHPPCPSPTLPPFIPLRSLTPLTSISRYGRLTPLTLASSKTGPQRVLKMHKIHLQLSIPRILVSSVLRDDSIPLCRACWKLPLDTRKESGSWHSFAFSSDLDTCCWMSGDIYIPPFSEITSPIQCAPQMHHTPVL